MAPTKDGSPSKIKRYAWMARAYSMICAHRAECWRSPTCLELGRAIGAYHEVGKGAHAYRLLIDCGAIIANRKGARTGVPVSEDRSSICVNRSVLSGLVVDSYKEVTLFTISEFRATGLLPTIDGVAKALKTTSYKVRIILDNMVNDGLFARISGAATRSRNYRPASTLFDGSIVYGESPFSPVVYLV